MSKLKNTHVTTKTTTSIDFEKALKNLQEQNLSQLLFCTDPNLVLQLLTNKLTNTLSSCTTTISVPNNKRIIKPWITLGILRCIRNRNKLQKQTRNDPYNDILKITFNRYRNYCNYLIKKIKRKYERELILKSTTDGKLLWKNIKKITYTTKVKSQNSELLNIRSSPMDSANFINNHFANTGKQLAQQILIQPNSKKDSDVRDHSPPSQPNTFVLLDTDPKEVEMVLMSLKSDSAPGSDRISTKLLKYGKKEVVHVIAHLVNLCFGKGIFPAPLKQAIITPVYKGGDKDDVNNYRPISVLSSLSKKFEKLLNNRLKQFLNKFQVLSPSQYGFRQGISTEDAVSALSSLVVDHLDRGNKCLTVFLDLKKAFDTVSVPILVNKLEKAGIRGTPLMLFKDYLTTRKQMVRVGPYTSNEAEVSYGVPQGSVLGPTLFLVYVNDLCNMKINDAKVFSYADDTAVVFTGKSWDEVKTRTELGLAEIASWLNSNLLTLNTNKTNYICFSIIDRTQPKGQYIVKVHVCGNTTNANCDCATITKVTKTKYLGVVIDQKLSWYPHLEQVTNRVRKLNWIFRTLRHIVPRNTTTNRYTNRNILNEIYVALVQPVLVYCIPIWGSASKTYFIDVERAQRAVIKTMYFKKKNILLKSFTK